MPGIRHPPPFKPFKAIKHFPPPSSRFPGDISRATCSSLTRNPRLYSICYHLAWEIEAWLDGCATWQVIDREVIVYLDRSPHFSMEAWSIRLPTSKTRCLQTLGLMIQQFKMMEIRSPLPPAISVKVFPSQDGVSKCLLSFKTRRPIL